MSEELAVPVGNYRVKNSVILTVVKILFSLQNGKRIGTRRYPKNIFVDTIFCMDTECLTVNFALKYQNDTVIFGWLRNGLGLQFTGTLKSFPI